MDSSFPQRGALVCALTAALALSLALPARAPAAVDPLAADPGAGLQWHLRNAPLWPGGPALRGRVDEDLRVPLAWVVGQGAGVVVAVVDSGVDLAHPDLRENLWQNPGERPGNGEDDDGNGFVDDVHGADFADGDGDPDDVAGHGTHVAGIVAAGRANGVGGSGIAPAVRLMAVRAVDEHGDGDERQLIRAVRYAVRNGADVVNVSLGYYEGSARLCRVFRWAARRAVVVAAAGNEGEDLDREHVFPASCGGDVVAVAATDADGELMHRSATGGESVTVAAPGAAISSALDGGGHGSRSGTSQAAAVTAGVAALGLGFDRGATPREVAAALVAGARRSERLAGVSRSGGRVDAVGTLVELAQGWARRRLRARLARAGV